MTDTTSPALRTWLAYYEAWTNRDLDTAMSYIADDIVCDTPDGQRVDPFSVDDADGGGDHVVRRDLASFAARALLNRRHAYNVAY